MIKAIQLIAALSLLGCQAGSPMARGHKVFDSLGFEYPEFLSLARACEEEVGGTFDRSSLECHCADPHMAFGNFIGRKPSCFYPAEAKLIGEHGLGEAAKKLHARIQPFFGNMGGVGMMAIDIVTGSWPKEVNSNSIFQKFDSTNLNPNSKNEIKLFIFEPNAEALSLALGNTKMGSDVPNGWDRLSELSELEPEILDFTTTTWREFQNFFEKRSKEFKPTKIHVQSDRGCLDSCIAEENFGRMDAFYVKRVRSYVGGALFADQYNFKKDINNHTVDAKVVFNLGGGISLVAIPRENSFDGPRLFRQEILVFDREGRLLAFPYKEEVPYLTPAKVSKIPNVGTGNNIAVICDGGLARLEDSQIARYARGPFWSEISVHRLPGGQRPTGSILGWVENQDGDPWLALEGTSGDLGTIVNNHGPHAKAVAEAFLSQSSSNRIIPFEFDFCLKHAEHWAKTVSSAGVKVINLSAADMISKTDCMGYGDHTDAFLKVIAAGNGGHPAPDPYICPHNKYRGSDQAIYVAATDSSYPRLDPQSNYGADWVDIAAQPTGGGGTSFAAPVVSSVAARIAQSHPGLSVQEIRLALLVGSRIPCVGEFRKDCRPLPVRSGGIVNLEMSLVVADAIALNPLRGRQITTDWVRSVLSERICGERATCHELDSKLYALRRGGLVKDEGEKE